MSTEQKINDLRQNSQNETPDTVYKRCFRKNYKFLRNVTILLRNDLKEGVNNGEGTLELLHKSISGTLSEIEKVLPENNSDEE